MRPNLWWLSFADPHRPAGTQFLGVAIVEATDFLSAISKTHRLGINPGGECRGISTDAAPGMPQRGYDLLRDNQNRLLTKDDMPTFDAKTVEDHEEEAAHAD